MKISEDGINLIKAWEGLVDGDPTTVLIDMYLDPVGLPTIGWGHLIKSGEDFSGGITEVGASNLLRKDVQRFEKAVTKRLKRTVTQEQFDALVSFTFNVGVTAFEKSTLRQWVNANDRDLKIPQQFTRWVNAGGKPFRGLALRRLAESEMWIRGCKTR
jgi:lysozyme